MRSVLSRPGKDFASILEQLEEDALRDFFRPVAGAQRFWPGESGAEGLGAAAVAGRYAENQADGATTRPPPPQRQIREFQIPDFQIPEFQEIAAEIAAIRSADKLRALRRALALAAHPDRVPVGRRAEAEKLMAKVNAAIDGALSML